ncbi:MAG: hypothetical protein JWM56_853 [Candidatus Peribacteria bacterium]|nr:hypothetical protein [Candidatus Peribacteria bacterium]
MTFNHFDAAVRTNEFWTLPIERINQNLERNQQKDMLQRPGISAIVGCPLPQALVESMTIAQKAVDRTLAAHGSSATIEWRKQPEAFHFSVYGLLTPGDYGADAWPLRESQISCLEEALHAVGTFTLDLQGIGVLGMGSVSIRVSDSPKLEELRDAISSITGFSQEKFGSRTKKITLGRLRPGLSASDRLAVKATCESLQGFTIGSLTIDHLAIVHYQNTFMDEQYDKIIIR